MDNSGQYKSLFKSFRKAHPGSDSTESQGPKFTAVRPTTSQKTVDELLAGRAEVRTERRTVEEGPETARRRKSIDHILAGAKARRPTYGSRNDPGDSESSGDPQPVTRKPISEILANSSTVLRPLKSSHGIAHLPTNKGITGTADAVVKPETSVSSIRPLKSSHGNDKIVPEAPSAVKVPEPLVKGVATNFKSENKPAPFRRTQSQRVLFDFSSPVKVSRSRSVQECLVPIRPKMLEKYVEITSVPSVITFTSSGQADWRKNKAFDALLSSIEDETETAEFDSRYDEECQTDNSYFGSKWTQHPVKFSTGSKSNLQLLKRESIGAACDQTEEVSSEMEMSKVTEATSLPMLSPREEEENLVKFARNTSKLLLSLISVNTTKSTINVNGGTEKDGDDSKGRKKSNIIEFDRGLPYLNKLAMHTLHCDKNHIACANVPLIDRTGNEKQESQEVKNIVTVWSAKEPGSPKYFLRVWGQVTTIKLAFASDIIVAGSHNGGLNIWDLREDEQKHVQFEGVYVRTPSFHTGCLEGENHHSEIIGLEVLAETKSSAQIISLEKDNKIICWSCIHSPVVDRVDFSVNSVAWSTLRVRVRQVLNLNELFKMNSLTSTCMNVWEGHHKYFVMGTNNGFVGKGRIVASTFDTHCEKFFANTRDSLIRIHHIDVNVKINLIIAACGDYCLRLFEMSKEKAIISIACAEVPGKVLWSKQRLSVFYVAFKDQVVIWDLIASDLTPMKKCKSSAIVDFQLVILDDRECMIVIALGGKKLFRVIPPCNLTPLDENHEKLMRHYITVSL